MDDIKRSLSEDTSVSQAAPTTGGLLTPPSVPASSSGNRSVSARPTSLQQSVVTNVTKVSTAGPSLAEDTGLEPALEGLHVTGRSQSSHASGPLSDNPLAIGGSSSSRWSNHEAELEANGLVILKAHEGNEKRRHYNPDEDEVESNNGDATSEDGIEPSSCVGDASSMSSINSKNHGEIDTEVGGEVDEGEPMDEDEDAESESDDDNNDDDDSHDGMPSTHDDEGDSISSQPPVDLERVGCSNECRREFCQGVEFYDKQVEALENKLRNLTIANNGLKTEVVKANQQIEKLKWRSVSKKRTQITWHEKLCLFITEPGNSQAMPYNKIYRLCCKEENMSTRIEYVHPDLRLRPPKNSESQQDILQGLSTDEAENDGPTALFVQDDEQPGGVNQTQSQTTFNTFPFSQLPASVQGNILKFVFVQENRLIHCISRLDPYIPPEDVTGTNAHRSGLPHRFHISGKSCNISYAIKPTEHLALLSVCKRWYYLGVHAFYGLNTFAFSSLGEFGRFCNGIGAARRQRIQHIELLWMGNQYLTHRPLREEGKNGHQLKWVSKRTWDISSLCQMHRLKSLTVHIDESGNSHKRRNHEPSHYINWMASITAGQPNFRPMRSLRTVQGLEFIYQLRGMELIQFYDYEMARKHGGRHPIRDWSFYMDIENVTAMPKAGERAKEAEFENLTPVLANFVAPDEYLDAVKDLYRQSDAFDAKHVSPPTREEDDDGDIEMPDIVIPVQKHQVTVAQKTSGSGSSGGDRTAAPASKKSRAAIEVRDDSAEGDTSSDDDDDDATPKAIVRNARSDAAATLASTLDKNGDENKNDDGVSLVGSNAENPIELEDFEPKMTPRLYKLQQEQEASREPSLAGSISSLSSRESERSFDTSCGLFVRSSTRSVSQPQSRRESTAMTETLRKRGFNEPDVHKAINLTELDDDMGMGMGYPK
ncbi:hypothetical protein QIS74_10249 [Colletotrichum tabaci]|uniref:DUF7730 domain-containing protein n=1 Tax=Colletotrichum tabaci TaxID=1209068 RepID=A0AAV9T070_9PEZI